MFSLAESAEEFSRGQKSGASATQTPADGIMSKRLIYFLLILLLLAFEADCNELYLLHTGPTVMGNPAAPHEVILYKYVDKSKSLDKVWTMGDYQPENISIFDRQGLFLVIGAKDSSRVLYQLIIDSTLTAKSIPLENNSRNFTIGYCQQDIGGEIVLGYNDRSGTSKYLNLWADDITRSNTNEDKHPPGELRVQGLGSPYYSLGKSALSFDSWPVNGKEYRNSGFIYTGPNIPDSIRQFDSETKWIVIADEKDYVAFLSVPKNDGRDTRELILNNKLTGKCKSILVNGNETDLKNINGFLAGVVAHTSSKGSSFKSVCSDSSVVIDPMTFEVYYWDLGKFSEVLWVENDSILCRTENQLIIARLNHGEISAQEILFDGVEVNFIHWAFIRN